MGSNTFGLNVLTLNVHKGFSFFNRKFILPELRDAVRDAHVDIVFLQEVIGAHAQHALNFDDWPSLPQYEFLADTIWSDFAYGKNAVYPHGHHGNAVLSKYPILHHENRDVSFGVHEKRGLLHCVLDVPKQSDNVHVICVHLGLRETHRRQQLGLLTHMIDKEVPADAPLIVAGDFNDWRLRGHPVLMKNAAMREVFSDSGGRPAKTFPARWPFLRLDRIYVRNVTVVKPRVLSLKPWSHLSDHAALMTEVML